MGRIKEQLICEKEYGMLEPTEIDYDNEDWYNALYAETANDEEPVELHHNDYKRA